MSTFSIRIPYYYKTYYEENFYRRTRGVYEIVSSDYISSSLVNDFVPYHALLGGKLYSAGDEKELVYELTCPYKTTFSPKSYRGFFSTMLGASAEWVRLAKNSVSSDFRCRPHELVEIKDGKIIPLITLVASKSYIFNMDKDKLDLSKFFLLIDKKFIREEEYSVMYRNTTNHYLNEAMEVVNTIVTPSIKQFCYKPPVITPVKVNTIIEQRTQMSNLNKRVFSAVRQII